MENNENLNSNQVMNSNNKTKKILIALIILVVIVGAFYFLGKNSSDNQSENKKNEISELEIGKKEIVKNNIEFSIVSNKLKKKVEPKNPTKYYNYYEAAEGKKYLDLELDVKNISEESIKQSEAFITSVEIKEKSYISFVVTDKENGEDFQTYPNLYDIKPLETLRYHILAEIPESELISENKIEVYISVKEQKYKYTISISDNNQKEATDGKTSDINIAEKGKEISLNETVVIDNQCEFTVLGTEINKKIEPPSATGYYTYYAASDGKKFFDITIDIKNLKETAVKQDAVFGIVKLEYDGKYEYECFTIVEEENGEDFNGYPSLYDINPLETLRYHFLVEIPEEVETSDKELVVKLPVKGNDYIFKIR